MQQLIVKKLDEIERQENVRILLAVESGSRAWVCPQSHRTLATVIVRQQGFPPTMSTMLRS